MCNFFSLVSTGNGKPIYFDWELRKKCLSGELYYSPDSHTSIADYFGYKGKKEDKLNKYEYNPFTEIFRIDQLNTKDDSRAIEVFCRELNFKKVIPLLIVKPIINPFNIVNMRVTKNDLVLLKEWDSVRDSVGDSVWDSVRDSVRDSVWDSVWDSVRDSVWDSVWAYISSFFHVKKWKHLPKNKNYDCVVQLWEKGLVPSYDGKIWRLHAGKDAKIAWEGKICQI